MAQASIGLDELEAHLEGMVRKAGLGLSGPNVRGFVDECLNEGLVTAVGGKLNLLPGFDEAWQKCLGERVQFSEYIRQGVGEVGSGVSQAPPKALRTRGAVREAGLEMTNVGSILTGGSTLTTRGLPVQAVGPSLGCIVATTTTMTQSVASSGLTVTVSTTAGGRPTTMVPAPGMIEAEKAQQVAARSAGLGSRWSPASVMQAGIRLLSGATGTESDVEEVVSPGVGLDQAEAARDVVVSSPQATQQGMDDMDLAVGLAEELESSGTESEGAEEEAVMPEGVSGGPSDSEALRSPETEGDDPDVRIRETGAMLEQQLAAPTPQRIDGRTTSAEPYPGSVASLQGRAAELPRPVELREETAAPLQLPGTEMVVLVQETGEDLPLARLTGARPKDSVTVAPVGRVGSGGDRRGEDEARGAARRKKRSAGKSGKEDGQAPGKGSRTGPLPPQAKRPPPTRKIRPDEFEEVASSLL